MQTSSLALLLSVIALFISIFSFFYLKTHLKRRTSKEHFLKEIQQEADIIVKTINEITDRDISLILEREKNLRELLKDTERRSSVLVKEMERFRNAETVYAQIVPRQDAQTSSAISYQELGKNRHRLKAEPATEPVPEPVPEPEPVSQEKLSISEQIISLVQADFPISVIAARLGISISQVELAIALHEQRDMGKS